MAGKHQKGQAPVHLRDAETCHGASLQGGSAARAREGLPRQGPTAPAPRRGTATRVTGSRSSVSPTSTKTAASTTPPTRATKPRSRRASRSGGKGRVRSEESIVTQSGCFGSLQSHSAERFRHPEGLQASSTALPSFANSPISIVCASMHVAAVISAGTCSASSVSKRAAHVRVLFHADGWRWTRASRSRA